LYINFEATFIYRLLYYALRYLNVQHVVTYPSRKEKSMNRKLTVMLVLSIFLISLFATSAAVGADKPLKNFKDRATIPARFAPTYGFPGMTGDEYTPPPPLPEKMSLRGAKSRGPIHTIGETTYDYQSNCTMGRQAEHRVGYSNPFTPYGLYIHFDWMAQTGDTLGQGRGIGYQAYEIAACDFVFVGGGVRVENDFAGYPTMDAHNIDATNSWAVPAGHETLGDGYVARAYWDFNAQPVFGMFTNDYSFDYCGQWLPDCDGRNIWPKISWDIDGAEQVLHMVASEFGGAAGDPQSCSYYRRVGSYGTGNGVWSDQRIIDTVVNVNVDVASSPISDRVAIIWNAPADYLRDTPTEFDNQYENDVWYCMADDNGADWGDNPSNMDNPSIAYQVDHGIYDGANITNYDPMNDYKAYCDMSALFAVTTDAPGDELHIAWGCRRWTDTTSLFRRQSAIFHWRESNGEIKTVVKADWDSGGACYAYSWGSDVAKMTISECDNKIYMCYTQFGDRDHPCDWYDADNNVVSGYLYVTVYDPIYGAWDRPQRVTGIAEGPTGCLNSDMAVVGDCNSEYWSSMARYGRLDSCETIPPDDVLDIVYINDLAPGGVIQDESGIWALNPVNWVTYPCREAVPEPGYSDDAGPGYGLCYGDQLLTARPIGDTSITLMLENFGILDNDFSIVAAVDSSNSATNGANTAIGVTPPSGTIPGKGGSLPITIQITTTGELDFTTVYATITVTHEAAGSPRVIPMCITILTEDPIFESAILSTACKRLKIYNFGQLSNNAANASMDFNDAYDPDDCANLYLYDGSPIICRDDGGTKRCYFAVFDNAYASEHAMRPISPLFVDSLSNESYTYASSEFITGDSTIGIIAEYFVPKHADSCSFIIEKLKFWNRGSTTLYGVAAGEALDWDIPSFENSLNESDYDASRELIYQYCGCPDFNDPCDTTLQCERYGGIAAYGGAPFKNYMTLENDVYVYTSGPFGNEAPLPDDTIYGLMTGVDGFSTAALDSCEDLMTLVTFGVYDLEPNDTICVIKILSTSREDANQANLKANIDKANAFIDSHEEIKCETFVCDCLPGDANGDGQVNVGDAVYVIGYVFKGGPAPTPYPKCSGDANGDCQCNVGDAVYIIGYVFKGGPPPVTCDAWIATCGVPIQ